MAFCAIPWFAVCMTWFTEGRVNGRINFVMLWQSVID